jgi:hypothetical protein
MTFAVPEPVAAYLAAEAEKNADAISRCLRKTAQFATRDVSIAGATRCGSGKRRQTQYTNTSWRWLTFERSEIWSPCVPDSPVSFLGAPLN